MSGCEGLQTPHHTLLVGIAAIADEDLKRHDLNSMTGREDNEGLFHRASATYRSSCAQQIRLQARVAVLMRPEGQGNRCQIIDQGDGVAVFR